MGNAHYAGHALDLAVFQPPKTANLKTRHQQYLEWLRTPQGINLPFLFFTCGDDSTFTILYFHANAEEIGELGSYMRELVRRTSCNVLCMEYPGYGMVAGKTACSEQGCYDAAIGAYDWITTNKKIASNRIIVWGRSLGSAVAAYIASEYPVGGLVFQNGFRSIYSIGLGQRSQLKGFKRMGDYFSSAERMQHIFCPVYFVHGDEDMLVPMFHVEEMYKQHNRQTRLVAKPFWIRDKPYNDHNNSNYHPDFHKFLVNFVQYCFLVQEHCDHHEHERVSPIRYPPIVEDAQE
ncbi:MAG: uncharacterized protein KVP18_004477 [Porospora cf. gigantea A]|uniref:uncharacterized protein n=1 Tax=Porospora cf. gigantea A TaxID=2853593 RepID=UPI003559E09F|nr:MAG: hypothetical protein KVP18_004477 [Porospora cf. gigantea A]